MYGNVPIVLFFLTKAVEERERVRDVRRRVSGLAVLMLLAVTAGGCIFLDAGRRSNFTGPSWDVEYVIPLVGGTYSLAGVNGTPGPGSGSVGPVSLGSVQLTFPDPWPGGVIDLGELDGDHELAADVDLRDVWSALDDEFFNALTVDVKGELQWRADVPDGVTGSLMLTVQAEKGPDVREASGTLELGGVSSRGAIDVSELLALRPDQWHVAVDGELLADDAAAGALALHFDLLLEVEVTVEHDTTVELGEELQLAVDSDVRARLRDLPLSDVRIAVDIDPRPLAFVVALRFADGAADPDPAYLAVGVGVHEADLAPELAQDWRAVLDKLAGADPRVQAVLKLPASDQPVVLPPSVTVLAHMVIRADVNKR